MKPTPAQIEAAAKAMQDNAEHWDDYELLAKLALTAAARVSTSTLSPDVFGIGSDYLSNHTSTTVAAEVEPLTCLDIKMATQSAVNATIERCAQVAEKHWIPGPYNTIPQDIAAAIRKLKEEK